MKTKLLSRYRKIASEEIGVYYNKETGFYDVRHKSRIGGGLIATYATTMYPQEAKKKCDEYRRLLILRLVRELKFGYEEASEGRIY